MLGEGRPVKDICALLSLPTTTVYDFKTRHAAAIEAHAAEVDAKMAGLLLASKERRIAAKSARHMLLELVRRERAAGRDGTETGLIVKTVRKIGRGEDAEYVEEYAVDKAMLNALDQLERDVAEELGQLPRGANINVFAGNDTKLSDQQQRILDRIAALAAGTPPTYETEPDNRDVIDVTPPTLATPQD